MPLDSDINLTVHEAWDGFVSYLFTAQRCESMYLTHSINADISFVLRAGGAVFDLAGHGEEEVVVFCDAVQLADVLICTETNKHTETLISIKISNCCIKDVTKFYWFTKVLPWTGESKVTVAAVLQPVTHTVQYRSCWAGIRKDRNGLWMHLRVFLWGCRFIL